MSNKSIEYMLPAILKDLEARHPREKNTKRLAQAANWIYTKRCYRSDEWGRLVYHPEVRAIVPRCFDAPVFGIDDVELIERYRDGTVGEIVEIFPDDGLPKRPPTEAEKKLLEADALAEHYAAVQRTYDAVYEESLTAEPGNVYAARERAIAAARALKGDEK